MEETLPDRDNRGIYRAPVVCGRRLDHRRILDPPYALVINELSWEDRFFVVADKPVHRAPVSACTGLAERVCSLAPRRRAYRPGNAREPTVP